ncbi:23S rRNA (guanine(745)-N(1))-methyltransferase [Parashewanella spongiae]|uniref:23S rRNA (Guanine(745)-N(1))-methyltransferase n=1 Tax=Parashewanella spongiae TaxID=342950 RepID=A0A3A6TK34_9GAMM|nr:23S rRNA (guanine(745)-N(1))-methyltransferase [Parashewanella spongiae]MCL1079180.1 23S rRNA (guanine(745)-N(1))-methyltransferase [Parashewanella spongiae]RJY10568.1 23S rRNA (guanine(745)-N(1))-methyltransferase [Parashewanella spongiae]
MPYICPLCAQPLSQIERTYKCKNRHSFDIAKEGYVNLLPVHKKSSIDPGDNKEMMRSRREFLDKGFYQYLSDRINQLILEFKLNVTNLLDIGCGEGYYTNRLVESLSSQSSTNAYGLDISKTAVKLAAKRYKDVNFCVASAFDTPFADNSFDGVLKVYAPSALTELKRIIKQDGYLITVSPGPEHHWFLKTVIYSEPKLNSNEDDLLEGFELVHSERLQSLMSLNEATDVTNFLSMTPYAWKLSEFQKSQLCANNLKCELDFKIQIHKRC